MKSLIAAVILTFLATVAHAQTPGAFSVLTTIDTSADSLHVGCAVSSSACTGGIKAGLASFASGLAIDGGTISTHGIVMPSAVPASSTNAFYNSGGTLYFGVVPIYQGLVTTGTVPKANGSGALVNSLITESGTVVTITGTAAITGTSFTMNGGAQTFLDNAGAIRYGGNDYLFGTGTQNRLVKYSATATGAMADSAFTDNGTTMTSSIALVAPTVRGVAVAFASLPGAPVEGMMAGVTDSNTATWGANIAGGGANHVLGYYNGTNWTVAGK